MTTDPDSAVVLIRERSRHASATWPAHSDKLAVVIADALALAFSSDGTPVASSLDRLVGDAPAGPATVIGRDDRVSVDVAILANSTRIHSLLLDDAHSGTMVHPGAVVLPVAFALGEELDAPGSAVAAAIAAGYEAFVAAAAPVAVRTAAAGFRNTSLFGAIGAAAAAATLLELDDDRFDAALLTAFGTAGGTLQAFRAGSPDWRFQPGLAARNGLAAARIAAALDPALLPFPVDALDGPEGVYATLVGEVVDWRQAIASGGSALTEISHKAHATCGANQIPVGAMSAILAAGAIAVDDIARIDVRVSQASFDYPGCEDRGPFTEEGAFLSRPFAVAATALAGGGPLRAAQVRAALADDRLEGLVAKIHSSVIPDAELAHPQDGRVEVTLTDGSTRAADSADVDPHELRPDVATAARRLRAAAPSSPDELLDALDALPTTSARALLAAVRGLTPRKADR